MPCERLMKKLRRAAAAATTFKGFKKISLTPVLPEAQRLPGWCASKLAAVVALKASLAAQESRLAAAVAAEMACHCCQRVFNSRNWRNRCRNCRLMFCQKCTSKCSLIPISAERAARHKAAVSGSPHVGAELRTAYGTAVVRELRYDRVRRAAPSRPRPCHPPSFPKR